METLVLALVVAAFLVLVKRPSKSGLLGLGTVAVVMMLVTFLIHSHSAFRNVGF
ncbi:hypothetical protein [Streptomyces sp. NPDC096033]|uniref:hypothetical protein n=1 Tax=Streptomyces sp. NPDC096033 TaxID=3366071 RepID=UPI0037F5CD30